MGENMICCFFVFYPVIVSCLTVVATLHHHVRALLQCVLRTFVQSTTGSLTNANEPVVTWPVGTVQIDYIIQCSGFFFHFSLSPS
jgi:hypothetical protein